MLSTCHADQLVRLSCQSSARRPASAQNVPPCAVPAMVRSCTLPYTDRASDLLRVCHRRRLRSAISVNPPLGLWGSSASRLGGWANKAGKAALNELSAPVLTIHDVPHRGITCRFGRSTVLPEHRSADQHRIIAIATPPPRRGPNGAEVAGRVVPPWGTAICSQHPCS
jgi:hypothetical protein